jgi:hypothetical protein
MENGIYNDSQRLYGGERDWLFNRLEKIETEMKTIQASYFKNIDEIHKNLSDLREYKVEQEAKNALISQNAKDKKVYTRWVVGLVITSFFSSTMAVIAIISLLIKLN